MKRKSDPLPELVPTIAHALHEASRVLVVTHVSPDGDAIGSLCAFGLALKQMGKKFTLACADNVPKRFFFLALVDQIQPEIDPDQQFDLLIALDCGDASRMGEVFLALPESLPPTINIDHHVTNTHFGDINLVDSDANATAEILCHLLPELGVTLTPDMANALLTGLVTDTLGFRTSGVTARTLSVASRLMEVGADLYAVTTYGLSLKPLSTLLLWQKGLDNMRLEDGLLWTSISHKERQEIGHLASSSSGLINVMAEVYQSAITAVLLELANGKVSVGFRCRPPFSVADLALNLGGGGHPLAAGCTLDGPLQSAEQLVVALSKETIRQTQQHLKQDNLLTLPWGPDGIALE
jgi:bifunctional oligoribonuclease and PAP phosphatase NrnA